MFATDIASRYTFKRNCFNLIHIINVFKCANDFFMHKMFYTKVNTHRFSISLSILFRFSTSLSPSLYLPLSISLILFLSFYFSHSLSVYLPLSLSLSLFLCISLSLFLCISLSLCLFLSLSWSLCLSLVNILIFSHVLFPLLPPQYDLSEVLTSQILTGWCKLMRLRTRTCTYTESVAQRGKPITSISCLLVFSTIFAFSFLTWPRHLSVLPHSSWYILPLSSSKLTFFFY